LNAPASLATTRWLESFAGALARGCIRDVVDLFAPECYWRDLVAFTWDIRTHEGRREIEQMLRVFLSSVLPRKFSIQNHPVNSPDEAWFSFFTSAGRGVGHLRLREGRAWTLLTALRELKGFPEKPGTRDPGLGISHQPFVVIVGGGQGGTSRSARA
jgi:putative flavoprotein involved in K+ transport